MQPIRISQPSTSTRSSSQGREGGSSSGNNEIAEFAAAWPVLTENTLNHIMVNHLGPMLGWEDLQLIGRALFRGAGKGPIAKRDPCQARVSAENTQHPTSEGRLDAAAQRGKMMEWLHCLVAIFESRMDLPDEEVGAGNNPHPTLRYACVVLAPGLRPRAERRTETPFRVLVGRIHRLAHLYFGCPFLRKPAYRGYPSDLGQTMWKGLPGQTVWGALSRCREDYITASMTRGGVEPRDRVAVAVRTASCLEDEIASIVSAESVEKDQICFPLSHLANSLLNIVSQLCPRVPQKPVEDLRASDIPGDLLVTCMPPQPERWMRQFWKLSSSNMALSLAPVLLAYPDSLLACIGQEDLTFPEYGTYFILKALLSRDWFRDEISQRGKDYLKMRLVSLCVGDMLHGFQRMNCGRLIELLKESHKGKTDLLRAWFANSEEWQKLMRDTWTPMWRMIEQHLEAYPDTQRTLVDDVLTAELLEALMVSGLSQPVSALLSLERLLASTRPDPITPLEDRPHWMALALKNPPVAVALIEHPDHWTYFEEHMQPDFVELLVYQPELLVACLQEPRAWGLLAECCQARTSGSARPPMDLSLMGMIVAVPGFIPMLLNDQIERPPFGEMRGSNHKLFHTALTAPGMLDQIATLPRGAHRSAGPVLNRADGPQPSIMLDVMNQSDAWRSMAHLTALQARALHIPGMFDQWAVRSSLWQWMATVRPEKKKEFQFDRQIFACPHVQAHLQQPRQRDVWHGYLCSIQNQAQLDLVLDPQRFAQLVAQPDLWPLLAFLR
ncbi:MAG: hypothetical protein ACOYKZ_03615 [Chlamydiia bacterium]